MDQAEHKAQLSDLQAKALRALARREYSVYELSAKLAQTADDNPALVATVIEKLLRQGLLSDQRFAEQLCRSRFQRGYGPARLRHELAQHRLDPELISACLAEYDGQWATRLREVKEKKFGAMPARDYKTWARQARFLQGRGFTSEQIAAVLTRP